MERESSLAAALQFCAIGLLWRPEKRRFDCCIPLHRHLFGKEKVTHMRGRVGSLREVDRWTGFRGSSLNCLPADHVLCEMLFCPVSSHSDALHRMTLTDLFHEFVASFIWEADITYQNVKRLLGGKFQRGGSIPGSLNGVALSRSEAGIALR